MIERVLVPMNDSEMAQRALRYALEAHPEADITVLHVVGAPSSMMGQAVGLALSDDPEELARDKAHTVFETAESIAAEYGIEIRTEFKIGHPVRGILAFIEDEPVDTVVMGTHGGTVEGRLFVGDVAKKIFRRSPVPVTSVR